MHLRESVNIIDGDRRGRLIGESRALFSHAYQVDGDDEVVLVMLALLLILRVLGVGGGGDDGSGSRLCGRLLRLALLLRAAILLTGLLALAAGVLRWCARALALLTGRAAISGLVACL